MAGNGYRTLEGGSRKIIRSALKLCCCKNPLTQRRLVLFGQEMFLSGKAYGAFNRDDQRHS